MATQHSLVEPEYGRTYRITWTNLANGDDGAPVSWPGAGDYTIQVFGTFGSGGVVILEGSCENVATNYFGLKDPQGNALSLTAAGGDMVSEVVTHVRPRVTAGDGSTDLTVILFFRSTM